MAAQADKQATAERLAAAEADYAMAKDAYDRLVAMLAPEEETPEGETEGNKKPAGESSKPAGNKTESDGKTEESVPSTGDPASLAGLAGAAGLIALMGAQRLRRRNDQ